MTIEKHGSHNQKDHGRRGGGDPVVVLPKGSVLYRASIYGTDIRVSENGESGPGVYTSDERAVVDRYARAKSEYAQVSVLKITTKRRLRLLDRSTPEGEEKFRELQRDPDTYRLLKGQDAIRRFKEAGYDGVSYPGVGSNAKEIVVHDPKALSVAVEKRMDDVIKRARAILDKMAKPGGGGKLQAYGAGGKYTSMGGGAAKKKTQAEKDAEAATLTATQYARYENAPASMDHERAMYEAYWGGSDMRGMHIATPEELARRPEVPKAWRYVYVSDDPVNGRDGLLARGVDVAGRPQPRYTPEFMARSAERKFKRVTDINKALDKLDAQLKRDVANGNETAIATMLIRKTGMRPGSTSDTRAKVKAYGATTLEARHVKVSGDTVHFGFVGKKGVNINLKVKDAELARAIEVAKAGKRGNTRLFPNTTSAKVITYMRNAGVDGGMAKDLRTTVANQYAASLIRGMTPPKSKTEFKRLRNQVGDQVAAVLGNQRTQALKSYINPGLFGAWEKGVGA